MTLSVARRLPAMFVAATFAWLGIMPLSFAVAEPLDVWIGTSNHKTSQGIYHTTIETRTGKLQDTKLVAEMSGPGFLELHPSGKVLYAVGSYESAPSVVAYRIQGNAKNRSLEYVGHEPIGDAGPCHVSVSADGRMLLTAQYSGGSVAAFALADDGTLGKRTALIDHGKGSGVVPRRQDDAHAHWTGFSPDGRFAFVPDLGRDEVVIYRVDSAAQTIHPHGAAKTIAGGGPRHMKFHPTMPVAYVLNELDLSVTVYDFDDQAGTLEKKQVVEAVSKADLAKEKFKSASEIRVHPSGQYVYSANRGHDTLTTYAVAQDGSLEAIGLTNVRGATPRNFNVTPDGRWAVVAGQDSHTLASFEIADGGKNLIYNRSIVSTPAPICVLFGRP